MRAMLLARPAHTWSRFRCNTRPLSEGIRVVRNRNTIFVLHVLHFLDTWPATCGIFEDVFYAVIAIPIEVGQTPSSFFAKLRPSRFAYTVFVTADIVSKHSENSKNRC